ncbi:hypothetical protein ACLDYT_02455 [Acinetobacter baumannii]|uniref:hypothetical protein n=1 Tax=Acinetobacter baumannii TaxID=470 RepID=UPI0002818A63|nr:hypothetical protein [Acinetobacter baumannii]EKB37801.1 hypothetical protein W9K_00285 [Acinetobacter baumannii Ab33333]MCJ1547057.1 hypothetical protein [Acinetobacter baumannii]MCP9156576.1 phage holin family protein [Acinetobacter baumannii]MCP9286830.1 hypothetical protein [Acinetobacter baumannii]MDR8280564.1 hypothetical protein [Acinetobacter baumannii]
MTEPASTTSTATYGLATNVAGGTMALVGGLSTTEWMAVLGGVCAVLGFIVQAIAAYRKDQRDEELQRKLMGEDSHDKQD